MKEILQRILAEQATGQPLMLVTVVADSGSSPRGAGATMLISAAGRLLGSVGGGAVEHNSMLLAAQWLAEQHGGEQDFALHPSKNNDIGMICGGNVTLQFCYITPDNAAWAQAAELALAELAANQACWLRHADQLPPALFNSSGQPICSAEQGIDLPQDKRSCLSGSGFLSYLAPGQRAIVFGGGHISQELVPLLARVGFRCTVYEDRAEYVTPQLFPTTERLICAPYEQLHTHLQLDEDDFVAVMTHGHAADYTVQEQVMRGPYAYLGVIGSRAKIAMLNKRLREQGISDEALAGVHTPIGLSIKAVTPAEIAVAIVAEMILVRAERTVFGEQSCPMH